MGWIPMGFISLVFISLGFIDPNGGRFNEMTKIGSLRAIQPQVLSGWIQN